MAIEQIDYETQGGTERARIYRDRLRRVESEHLGLVADALAGREYDQARVDALTGRVKDLKDAIGEAEAGPATQEPVA